MNPRIPSLLTLVFLLAAAFVSAETDDLLDEDIDSLFEEPVEEPGTEQEPETETESEPAAESEPDLIEEVVYKKDFTFEASFSFIVGYSPGFSYTVSGVDNTQSIQYDDLALLKISSALSLDVRISPEFRVFQKYAVSFPEFTPEIREFFCDYTLKDFLYFRIGRYLITWGQSPNFAFTNLTARVTDDYAVNIADSLAIKINLPIGIGGFEALAHTRTGYLANPNAPAMDEIGYGGNFNLAVENFDLTVGTFYQKRLHYRAYGSVKTTLFRRLELYSEVLIAHDFNYTEPGGGDTFDDQTDFSANLGFFIDFFSQNLELNGEYFFNGEESQLTIKGSTFPLFYGHNIAANLSLRLFKKKLRLFTQFRFNFNDTSGYLFPGLRISAVPHCDILFGVPLILGPASGGYYVENPDPNKRPVSFVFSFILTGKK